MPKTRETVPKPIREAVLKEFHHRCAICGADRPHLHHIDENPSNSDSLNLIPLCPNCHLVDQHDATNAVPEAKLRFFRCYKHRLILRPQFNSLWRRMVFLDVVPDSAAREQLKRSAEELIDFVFNLSMGPFYAAALQKLLEPPRAETIAYVVGDPDAAHRRAAASARDSQKYREQLRQAKPRVEALVVELLDHQTWPKGDG